MADIPGRNSVCKVMHEHESGLNARRRTASSVMLVRPFVYVRCLLATSARYRGSRSISPRPAREVAAWDFHLELLLLPLRRYAGRCCCCDTAGRNSHARKTQRPNP